MLRLACDANLFASIFETGQQNLARYPCCFRYSVPANPPFLVRIKEAEA
jgi:hypothetical protein